MTTAFAPRALPYHPDSGALFAHIFSKRPNAVFLDGNARPDNMPADAAVVAGWDVDVLTSDPLFLLRTEGPNTTITDQKGVQSQQPDDPFALVQSYLPEVSGGHALFNGGAIGYFAYDLAWRIEDLPRHTPESDIPEMLVGIYPWAVVVDHQQQQSHLVGYPCEGFDESGFIHIYEHLNEQFSAPEQERVQANCMMSSQMNKAQYMECFDKVQQHIRAGDCYQINFAQRFAIPTDATAVAMYQKLRTRNYAPFAAYLGFEDFQVLSASPERFLTLRDGKVETKPIKGTRPRGEDEASDQKLAEDLVSSTKDRAENLMIVDLLRNDLGSICEAGSIVVSKLFELESFTSVHHLVSTVQGRLPRDKTALDLLRACFPGGSITGAPKLRAMEIIELLEPVRRDVYCGAIGYIGVDGSMDTNIAIRTGICKDGELRFYGGGGLVADSDPDAEYQETLDKVRPLIQLFNN